MSSLQDAASRKRRLLSGSYNPLQAAVVEQFVPRFAPEAKLLYLRDTLNKVRILEANELQRLGFPPDKQSKFPDLVLYWPRRKWLYLITLATSHGPVSPKRYQELEAMLSAYPAKRKYVSAFLSFRNYGRHGHAIAWNTDVWIAEAPDHLIHHNGDKFIGPRQLPMRKAKKRSPLR